MDMFFQGWQPILRVLIVGTLSYVLLIAALRVSGKRTLAKLNAFDLIVTIAFGSTFASILTSKDLPLAEGMTAIALLIALQYTVSTASLRFPAVARLVRSEPTLLLSGGDFCRGAMADERIMEPEMRAVLREHGLSDPAEARAVILETDGTFTVLKDGGDHDEKRPPQPFG